MGRVGSASSAQGIAIPVCARRDPGLAIAEVRLDAEVQSDPVAVCVGVGVSVPAAEVVQAQPDQDCDGEPHSCLPLRFGEAIEREQHREVWSPESDDVFVGGGCPMNGVSDVHC